MKRLLGGAALALLGLGLAFTPARAASVSYYNITGNNPNVGGQLSTDVEDAGSGQVSFTFRNNVGAASSITDIYFSDIGGLFSSSLMQSQISDSGAGVDFSPGATPANLPGQNGATPPFVTTLALTADSNPPAAPNGINTSSEWLSIALNLVGGATFSDVLAALGNGALRMGLHVQALAGGGSDSYVNNPVSAVPIPAALPLFATALAGMTALRIRRKRRA